MKIIKSTVITVSPTHRFLVELFNNLPGGDNDTVKLGRRASEVFERVLRNDKVIIVEGTPVQYPGEDRLEFIKRYHSTDPDTFVSYAGLNVKVDPADGTRCQVTAELVFKGNHPHFDVLDKVLIDPGSSKTLAIRFAQDEDGLIQNAICIDVVDKVVAGESA